MGPVENQQHRLTASGMDIPVGMKNPTSGDLSVMLNSVTAVQHPHPLHLQREMMWKLQEMIWHTQFSEVV